MRQYFRFAASEQGANHKKMNKVCQDTSGYRCFDDSCIIAVSDGHGGDDYIRTDRGSQFAVEETLDAFEALIKTCQKGDDSLERNTRQKVLDIENYILKQWHRRVAEDLLQEPIQECELGKVSDRYKERYQHEEYRARAYGATLLAVCVTENFWLGIQIGDGRCVRLRQDGQADEPIPWDDNCELNVTTSICDGNAIEEFRFAYGNDVPAAIFIGSDGIDDSYCSDEELHELYESIFQIFMENGEVNGECEIREYLPLLTRRGSGDDVSIAGIIDAEAPAEILKKIKAKRELKKIDEDIKSIKRELQAGTDRLQDVDEHINRNQMEYESLMREKKGIEEELAYAEQRLQERIEKQKETEEMLNPTAAAAEEGANLAGKQDAEEAESLRDEDGLKDQLLEQDAADSVESSDDQTNAITEVSADLPDSIK